MTGLLPGGFEDLEDLVEDWAMPTQNMRWDKRLASSREELIDFYQALLPHIEEILDHVDRFKIGQLPEDSARLFDLALMLAEISPNVELYDGDPNVPHSFEERRFVAVHGDDKH